jgi:hypothetical protein
MRMGRLCAHPVGSAAVDCAAEGPLIRYNRILFAIPLLQRLYGLLSTVFCDIQIAMRYIATISMAIYLIATIPPLLR